MNAEELRAFCLSLPSVEEDVKWENDLCFLIGGKMFAVLSLEPPFRLSFKTTAEQFTELLQRPQLSPAPYLARYYWLQATSPDAFSETEWKQQLSQAYHLIREKLPRKAQACLAND